MAAQSVCSFYRFGYCKHKEFCRKRHVKETCENLSCDTSNCIMRHPKVCKWYRDYQKCKFDPCLFLHKENNTEIYILKKENEDILTNIKDIENAVKDLDAKIVHSESIIDRLENIQNKFEKFTAIEKQIFDQESVIKTLVKRVNVMEDNLKKKDEIINDLVEKSKVGKSPVAENEVLVEDEPSVDYGEFKCSKCDFETFSKKGLKIHMKRKHTKYETLKYPRKCDLCEKTLENGLELRKHMKLHSFKGTLFGEYKCEECDFYGKSLETMEVHAGMCCSENFDCGLCNVKIETLENLKTHLVLCEVYECKECFKRVNKLSDIKLHVENYHDQNKRFYHLKMNRKQSEQVDIKEYGLSDV